MFPVRYIRSSERLAARLPWDVSGLFVFVLFRVVFLVVPVVAVTSVMVLVMVTFAVFLLVDGNGVGVAPWCCWRRCRG